MSIALGLLAVSVVTAQAQEAAPGSNQAVANAVAGSLQSSKALSRYRIEIETQDGQVTLSGMVASPSQKAEALARTRAVAGVSTVVDRLSVVGDRRVRPVQYQMAMGGHHGHGGDVIYEGAGAPVGPAAAPAAAPVGPLPEVAAGVPGQPAFAGPNMAGTNYPTTYPWAAWANTAPAYPNPEIPLGWKTVTLRWDDGIWWLDFKKTYTRPFFTPWPFQIWGY